MANIEYFVWYMRILVGIFGILEGSDRTFCSDYIGI